MALDPSEHPSSDVSAVLTGIAFFQRAGEYILAWADELEAQHAKLSSGGPTKAKASTLAKRPAKARASAGAEQDGAHDGARPAKKVKTESNHAGKGVSTEDEVRKNFERGAVSKVGVVLPFLNDEERINPHVLTGWFRVRVQLTVAVLKDFLTQHGRSTAGKKNDLVDRVEEICEEKNW